MTKMAMKIVAALASTGLVATPVLAKTASGLQDLVGGSGAGGEGELERRGYHHVQTHKDEYRSHGYWWNPGDKKCAHVVTFDGRYESITEGSRTDCNQKKDNTGIAVAAVAGVAVLGAILASKSHHREGKDYNDQQMRDFDRGYNDGLHNTSYHNYGRSDAYSDGYQAGVRERSANTNHHYGHGGYAAIGQYMDLRGDRASSADGQLRQRGFSHVDGFKSGSTAYSIWNRRSSHQCVQMTVADGRVYDIRDIRTHPKCH